MRISSPSYSTLWTYRPSSARPCIFTKVDRVHLCKSASGVSAKIAAYFEEGITKDWRRWVKIFRPHHLVSELTLDDIYSDMALTVIRHVMRTPRHVMVRNICNTLVGIIIHSDVWEGQGL